ncbi:MAG: hypothetical protein AB8B72_05290 [Crocinitomicaceae bacterium]
MKKRIIFRRLYLAGIVLITAISMFLLMGSANEALFFLKNFSYYYVELSLVLLMLIVSVSGFFSILYHVKLLKPNSTIRNVNILDDFDFQPQFSLIALNATYQLFSLSLQVFAILGIRNIIEDIAYVYHMPLYVFSLGVAVLFLLLGILFFKDARKLKKKKHLKSNVTKNID